MKQFPIVYRFELMNYFRKKVFLILTAILMAVILIVMFLPRFLGGRPANTYQSGIETQWVSGGEDLPETDAGMSAFEEPDPDDAAAVIEKDGVLLLLLENDLVGELLEAFSAAYPEYEVLQTDAAEEEIRRAVSDGEAELAYVIDEDYSVTYYVNNLSLYDSNASGAADLTAEVYRLHALEERGVSGEEAEEILDFFPEYREVSLGTDQAANFLYTYVMIMALYMLIMIYGQMVATAVASEKSSRAMELLVTSAKPDAMIFGKVLAAGTAGLVQMVAIFGTAFLAYRVNRPYWAGNPFVASLFAIPAELLLYLVIFFVLGFLLYAFLYGAIGSTASKMEDVQTSVMPLTFLFIIAFMIVIFSLTSGITDNRAIVIGSFIPFTSPMAMFTRICMSTVPLWQILLSIGILIVSVIGSGIIAARIYRIGVLMYGAPPKPAALFKAIREAGKN